MLTPYVEYNGAWSLSDTVMIGVWDQMVKHQLDKAVFFNEMKDEDAFLSFMKRRGNIVHVIHSDRTDMIAWINGISSNFALAHFCCFPHTWGKNSVELGKQSLEHWFSFKHDDGKPVFNVLMGRIPYINERAISYAQKCGMTESGKVPGISYGDNTYDTSFLYVTRGDYYGQRW